jgi:hypothetical protein
MALQGECLHLGIDVTYPDGSYSFVDDDFSAARGDIFEFLKGHVNHCGLLDNAEDVREFMRLHQLANDRGANLETLAKDVGPVELWEDADLSRTRRILAQ